MVDIKRTPNPLFLRDEELRRGIELLYFAYRAFVGEADMILSAQGFGRAHHRAIYFIGRHKGLNVRTLLDILQISKQSLARVLRDLIDKGYVVQQPNSEDRRQRLLYLTVKGQALETELTATQKRLLGQACKNLPPEAVEGFHAVLSRLIPNHKYVASLPYQQEGTRG